MSLELREKQRLWKEGFKKLWKEWVSSHNIKSERNCPSDVNARRIAYISLRILTTLFGKDSVDLCTDFTYCFYWWAKEHKISCNMIESVELTSKRKEVHNPYPSHNKRMYPQYDFKMFLDIATEILIPKRFPVLKRFPVSRLPITIE